MRVRNVVHSGRVMPPYNCTITIAGWHIFWLSLRSLLLGILRLLLILLPVLWDGVWRVDVEGGRRVKM